MSIIKGCLQYYFTTRMVMPVSPPKHRYVKVYLLDTRTDRCQQKDPYVLLCFAGDSKTDRVVGIPLSGLAVSLFSLFLLVKLLSDGIYLSHVSFCGASEAKPHIGITLSVIHPSVCLSFCHTLLLLVSQTFHRTLVKSKD